jgi:alpha-1,4-digalacturonate transport system permease protein
MLQQTGGLRLLRSPQTLLVYVLLVIIAVTAVFPFYWMVIGSFMSPVELFATIPHLWPSEFDTTSYQRIFQLVPMGRYFLNSALVSVSTTIIAVLVCSAAR